MNLRLLQILTFLQLSFLFSQTIWSMRFTYNPDVNNYYLDSSRYDVKSYYLNLEINDSTTNIKGFCEIYAQAVSSNLKLFVVELSDQLTIDSILFNSKPIGFEHQNTIIKVKTAEPVKVNQLFKCRIYYHGKAISSNPLGGINSEYNSNYNTWVTWTLSEPYSAHDWYPCKQQLTDKPDSVMQIYTVPQGVKVGSNGVLKNITEVSDKRIQYQWVTKYPIAYYLISFAAARYSEYSYKIPLINGDSLLYQNFIYDSPDYLTENKEKIDKLSEVMLFFEKKLGAYPFKNEKYGHCAAPIDGGMEHQTMTTIINFEFIYLAHELAHQWFGNNTTCSDWQNIWINEGFASFMEYMAVEEFMGIDIGNVWITDAIDETMHEPEGSVYVPNADVGNVRRVFNVPITYKKGAVLLNIIKKEMANDTLFYNILRRFLNENAYKNATAIDFISILNDALINTNEHTEASPEIWNHFLDEWYYGEGYPKYNINWWQKKDSLHIELYQKGSSEKTPLFHCNLQLLLHFDDFDTVVTIYQKQPIVNFSMYADNPLISMEINPQKIIPLTYSVNKKSEINRKLFAINESLFNDSIFIEFKDFKSKKIRIVDLSGKIYYLDDCNNKTVIIDTKSWACQLYVVIVEQDNEVYTAKTVKQN